MADNRLIHREARLDDLHDLVLPPGRIFDVLDGLVIVGVEAFAETVHRHNAKPIQPRKQLLHQKLDAVIVCLVRTRRIQRAGQIVIDRQQREHRLFHAVGLRALELRGRAAAVILIFAAQRLERFVRRGGLF